MYTLNLVDPSKSDIKFTITKFPDGQKNLTLITPLLRAVVPQQLNSITIIARITDFSKLELVVCAIAALRNIYKGEIALQCYYLLGARSDRKFQHGGTFYLKQVMADYLNHLKLQQVIVLDIHSDVANACIDNLTNIPNTSYVQRFCKNIESDYLLISPDAGAYKKCFELVRELETSNILTCSKHRDIASGQITDTIVPIEDLKGQNCLIVDDICDGGRTFIELAKKLKQKNCGKLYLFITHGIFSNGLKELVSYFDLIGTTDSFHDLTNSANEFVMRNENYMSKVQVFSLYH